MAWPVRAAQSLWNLGKRPFAGTGWRGGAKGIPAVEAQAAKPGVWRLPPGGRFNRDAQKIPYGARPAVPGSPAIPAGIARRRPVATAAVLGGAGLVGSSLLPDGTPDPTYEPRGGGGLGGVPPIGPPPVGDTFQSQLPGLVQRRRQERDSFLDNMQMVLGHSILLSFQNPGRESKYVENAIALLKGDAKSKGALEDAKIIEEVFKDNKVPKSAKTIYNRLVKLIGPKKAARSTAIGSKAYLLEEIIAESKVVGGFEAAVDRLASQWVSGGLDLDDIYSGYVGPKTYVEMEKLARALLEGQTGGGSRQGVPVNAEVSGTEVVGP